ncbi:ATP-binding protein [Streptomyces sp. NPDC026294]|uniref:ATP-binding protein n=1 Tax=Streptomyces sp. NPDC026294 TaxID=3155362 RepID=UPI003401B304
MEPLPSIPEAPAMPTLATRFVIAEADEVPAARRRVVESVLAWGVPMGGEAADAIRLVASELISNAVVHGAGPITVTLYHRRPGSLVIVVADCNQQVPVASGGARCDDEGGRGLALVGHFAMRSGWEPFGPGKRVWAEVELPRPDPISRAAVLRRFFEVRPGRGTGPGLQPLARTAA